MLGFMSTTGRGSPLIAVGLVLFSLQVLVAVYFAAGYRGSGAGDAPAHDVLGRPSLISHMPPSLPGWHKRAYLPADGEKITTGAQGRGIDARLAMGADLEQFRLFATAGVNGAASVYVRGEQLIAIGIGRDPAKTPDWVETNDSQTPWDVQLRRLELGQVIALIDGLAFQKRARSGAADIGYDRYVARIGHDLQVEVISNAPQVVVEQLLARFDAAALSSQLTEPSPVLDPEKGVILHDFPDTWPQQTDV